MIERKIPAACPSCNHSLQVEKLHCDTCATTVHGNFELPVFLQLGKDDQEFLMRFLKASGSLKEVAKQLGYSYPKVRNMLDEIIAKVKEIENQKDKSDDRK